MLSPLEMCRISSHAPQAQAESLLFPELTNHVQRIASQRNTADSNLFPIEHQRYPMLPPMFVYLQEPYRPRQSTAESIWGPQIP